MRARTRTLLAWSLWLASFGCCGAGLVVTLAVTRPLTLSVLAQGAAFALAFALGFATVGLVLSLRRPANPIGWLYAAAGLAWSWSVPVEPWITQLVDDHRPLPLAAQLAAVAADLGWAPAIALGVTLPALLLPDGWLRSRRWRLVVAASVTGAVMVLVFGSVAPERLVAWPIDNPFGLGGPAGTVALALSLVGVVLHWASLPAAAACVLLRFRASRGVERQQLRWVAAGVAGAVAGLLLALPGIGGLLPRATMLVIYPAMLCPPVAVAVAVLRYRLYDLDRIVSRALVYGLLTAAGVGLYVGVVRLAETLLRQRVGLGASLLATALIAVGFAPARDRLQRLVDRRLYGERHDPVRAVARLGERLRGTPGGAPGGDGLAEVLQGVRGAAAAVRQPARRPGRGGLRRPAGRTKRVGRATARRPTGRRADGGGALGRAGP
jgi:hypothetical protein